MEGRRKEGEAKSRKLKREQYTERGEKDEEETGVSEQRSAGETRRATHEVPESRAAVMSVPAMMLPLKAIPSIAIDQNASETTGFHELRGGARRESASRPRRGWNARLRPTQSRRIYSCRSIQRRAEHRERFPPLLR